MAVSNLKNNVSIIEQGTETVGTITWTYRKWSDGTAECWCTAAQTITGWEAWDSWWYSTPFTTRYGFPSGLFISAPNLNATKTSGVNGALITEYPTEKGTTPAFYLIRPESGATGTFGVSIYAIGTWR